MSYLFPLAFMSNSLAMTVLLIVLGLAGKTTMAADIGIIQGATLALFFALSANARNLILNKIHPVPAQAIMLARILLLLPIAGITFWLSTTLSGIDCSLAAVLILRRSVEWLGEVHLSDIELAGDNIAGKKYLITQSLLLLAAILWIFSDMPLPLLGLFMWALVPLLFSSSFIIKTLSEPFASISLIWQRLLPHMGSTTVIGVTVYIFRLLIILIVGKTIAGDLFTAFALGGVLGSIFASAIGPSVALHEDRHGVKSLPLLIRLALYVSLASGTILFITSVFLPNILDCTNKTLLFWQATSLSMIGGVVMVYAQVIRNRFLQQHKDSDVFGPDVLMNILVVAAVPFFYYLFGIQAMAGLFLLNALLALVFYRNCTSEVDTNILEPPVKSRLGRLIISVSVLLPFFFQLSSGIFRSPIMIYESGGVLTRLPIPLSVLVCLGGVMLLGEYRRATKSLNFLFLTFILMVAATVVVSNGQPIQAKDKFILLIQFILPMFCVFLGQVYDSEYTIKSHYIEKTFLYILVVIVPLQLLCTWLQGLLHLTSYLYLFSIYQHIQYVPVIFVSAYLISLYSLWPLPMHKKLLIALAPLMGIYSAASISILAPFLLISGLIGFALFRWKCSFERLPVIVLLLVVFVYCSYCYNARDDNAFSGKLDNNIKSTSIHRSKTSILNDNDLRVYAAHGRRINLC